MEKESLFVCCESFRPARCLEYKVFLIICIPAHHTDANTCQHLDKEKHAQQEILSVYSSLFASYLEYYNKEIKSIIKSILLTNNKTNSLVGYAFY